MQRFFYTQSPLLSKLSGAGPLSTREGYAWLSVDPLFSSVPITHAPQLSWIQLALANSDVFCFADYPCHTVVIDILKAPPEEDNREVATW